jgi:hypothetical protein
VRIHWFACPSNVLKFNLVDELEAYVLIKKGYCESFDGSMPELPHQYLLSMLFEQRKMPLSCEAREQL